MSLMKINHLTLTRENEITRAALIFPLISLRDKFVRILVNLVSDWLAQIISTKMKCRLRYSVQVKNLKEKQYPMIKKQRTVSVH